ncbi:CoA transferase [Mycobacterium sp. 48b]|uniref:CoA transferase n=1 Tax=Mycobacterium sp. 48b TaxID=3400426 RepID=UPI003AAA60D0
MTTNPGARGPLDGVRVIDATDGIAGPVATMILADFGADVVRLEDDRHAELELPGHVMWNRNKTVLPSTEAASDLVAAADLVVTTCAREAERLGVPVEGNQPVDQVHLHLPGWEPTDPPRRPVDALLADRMMQADFGIARRQTSFSGGPVECVYPFVSYLQGAWGATAAIATLIERVKTGMGQRLVIDPLHGAIVAATTTMFADPEVSLPTTSVGPGGPNPVFGTYQCGDGEWIFLGALGVKFQDLAFELLDVTDITSHPRIAANREAIYAVDLRDQVRARIAEGFRTKPRSHWLAEFETVGCPVSPVGERDHWLDHEQVSAMGQRVEITDPQVGRAVMGGSPVDFSAFPSPVFKPRRQVSTAAWPARPTPQSDPDSDSDALPGRGPLHGVKVLDLGTVLAGPYAGQLLAALGADVVKVETTKGDEFRTRGYMINRGQRSLSIDLRDTRGHATFLKLVAGSDVVVDNFRPGVLNRLGIDLDALRSVNPEIVTASITGYGGVGAAWSPTWIRSSGPGVVRHHGGTGRKRRARILHRFGQ